MDSSMPLSTSERSLSPISLTTQTCLTDDICTIHESSARSTSNGKSKWYLCFRSSNACRESPKSSISRWCTSMRHQRSPSHGLPSTITGLSEYTGEAKLSSLLRAASISRKGSSSTRSSVNVSIVEAFKNVLKAFNRLIGNSGDESAKRNCSGQIYMEVRHTVQSNYQTPSVNANLQVGKHHISPKNLGQCSCDPAHTPTQERQLETPLTEPLSTICLSPSCRRLTSTECGSECSCMNAIYSSHFGTVETKSELHTYRSSSLAATHPTDSFISFSNSSPKGSIHSLKTPQGDGVPCAGQEHNQESMNSKILEKSNAVGPNMEVCHYSRIPKLVVHTRCVSGGTFRPPISSSLYPTRNVDIFTKMNMTRTSRKLNAVPCIGNYNAAGLVQVTYPQLTGLRKSQSTQLLTKQPSKITDCANQVHETHWKNKTQTFPTTSGKPAIHEKSTCSRVTLAEPGQLCKPRIRSLHENNSKKNAVLISPKMRTDHSIDQQADKSKIDIKIFNSVDSDEHSRLSAGDSSLVTAGLMALAETSDLIGDISTGTVDMELRKMCFNDYIPGTNVNKDTITDSKPNELSDAVCRRSSSEENKIMQPIPPLCGITTVPIWQPIAYYPPVPHMADTMRYRYNRPCFYSDGFQRLDFPPYGYWVPSLNSALTNFPEPAMFLNNHSKHLKRRRRRQRRPARSRSMFNRGSKSRTNRVYHMIKC